MTTDGDKRSEKLRSFIGVFDTSDDVSKTPTNEFDSTNGEISFFHH